MTTSRRSSNKNNKMAKIEIIFSFILVWSIIASILLVQQFHNNAALERQLSESRKLFLFVKNREKKKKKQDELKAKYDDMTNMHSSWEVEEQDRPKVKELEYNASEKGSGQKKSMATNQFPFTRSLENFRNSKGTFIYVVQSTSTTQSGNEGGIISLPSPLQWSEVRWKDLVVNWGRNTTFDGLLKMSTRLEYPTRWRHTKASSSEGMMQKKFVLHCLPKAASTTLRRACYTNMKQYCKAIDFPVQNDPFGYRNVTDFFTAVKVCRDIDHFCIQGGDVQMSVINYEGEESMEQDDGGEDDEREPFHFIHMVPFRNFDDWVESAIKQIFGIDKNCDRINILLDQCIGYRELYMELYPKSVLSLLTGMIFNANGKGISGKDKHHILLYNYKDTDSTVSQVSEFFDIDPMPHTGSRLKGKGDEETCPDVISEKFHKCHDEALITADAIRNLKKERKRRTKNDRVLKTAIVCLRNGGGQDCVNGGYSKPGY
mmetsp:Transcript_3538/g.9039  ORF Transcript_3538/g.9039 Transcript_3538/m.9039 type:complete len:487 (+) Transcript_3538:123-1583(+)